MGQAISALRRNRGVNNNAQCPNALDEGCKKVISSKVEAVEWLKCEIDSTLSNIIERISRQAFPTSRKLETKTIRRTLLTLPTELILDIAGHLTPSGYMSLSYSCQTIRNQMGVSIAQVLGDNILEGQKPGSSSTVELRNIHFLERWEIRCMIDHDTRTRLRRREYSLSSTPPLSVLRIQGRNLDEARPLDSARCLLSTRLVWICPHRVLDCFETTRKMDSLHRCGSTPIVNSGKCYHIVWPVTRVLPNSVPSSEEVKEALNAFSAFLCPHLRLNAACVASLYNPECRRLQHHWSPGSDPAPDCCCEICSRKRQKSAICDFCDTEIQFGITARIHGVEILYVHVERNLEGIQSRSERAWVSQVTHPTDFEECEEAWRATHTECWRRLGLEGLYFAGGVI